VRYRKDIHSAKFKVIYEGGDPGKNFTVIDTETGKPVPVIDITVSLGVNKVGTLAMTTHNFVMNPVEPEPDPQ
jgi:hypothetical protein